MWNSFESFSKKISEVTKEGLSTVDAQLKHLKVNDVIEKARDLGKNLNLDNLQNQEGEHPKNREKEDKDSLAMNFGGMLNSFKDQIAQNIQAFDLDASWPPLASSHPQLFKNVFQTEKGKNVIFHMVSPVHEDALRNDVAAMINSAFEDRYLILNLSEKKYPTEVFNGNIFDYSFPGFTAMPLDLLFKIIIDVENFLEHNNKAAVFVHCLPSRTRSSFFLTCLVSYFILKQTKQTSKVSTSDKELRVKFVQDIVNPTFSDICKTIHFNPANCLPSQHRYLDYFIHIVAHGGVESRIGEKDFFSAIGRPLKVHKIDLKNGVVDVMSAQDKEELGLNGVRPHIQVFNRNNVIFSVGSTASNQMSPRPKVYSLSSSLSDKADIIHGSDIMLDLDELLPAQKPIYGDILLRARHIDSSSGKTINLFRYVFNTNFLALENLLRHNNEANFLVYASLESLDAPHETYLNKANGHDPKNLLSADLLKLNISFSLEESITDLMDADTEFWKVIQERIRFVFADPELADSVSPMASTRFEIAGEDSLEGSKTRKARMKQFNDLDEELNLLANEGEVDLASNHENLSDDRELLAVAKSSGNEIRSEELLEAKGSEVLFGDNSVLMEGEEDLEALEEYFNTVENHK